jgi:hypothetical protein
MNEPRACAEPRAALGGLMRHSPTVGDEIVQNRTVARYQWRAPVDESGHYGFAVAL